MGFPTIRPRRLRVSAVIDAPKPIGTMPSVSPLPLSEAAPRAREISARGIGVVIDLDRAMRDVLTSIRRAGADIILTYRALRAAEILGG